MNHLDAILALPTITHNLQQGSAEWEAFRLRHNGASEAAAMLGLSRKVTRGDLLRMKHTGLPREFSEWVQTRVLDHGHAVEALARPLVEADLGEDLYPVTCSRGNLSASCDGLTMDGETAFEHKQWNEELARTVEAGMLPDEHAPQCHQIMLVTGASRVRFVVSDGTNERKAWMDVERDPDWWRRIAAGWQQFETDLASYVPPQADAPAPVGHAPETLPALRIEVNGAVTASNLADFKVVAISVIRSVNRDLKNDQDFADADQAVKWCEDVEDRIKAAKAHALSQTASIDELFRTLDDISKEARAVRLSLEKDIKDRKETLRGEIVAAGIEAFRNHIASLNARIGKPYMPQIQPAFGEAIKGKRTVSSLRAAVDAELARAKIAASETADRIQINLRAILDAGAPGLFADQSTLALKDAEFVTLTIAQRLTDEKRRQDEAAEAAQRAAQADAAQPAPVVAAPVAVVATVAPANVVSIARPSADDGKRLKLGDINARLAPIALTADGLAGLGFKHVAVDKAAKLYREADFPLICNALVAHVNAARDTEPMAA